jgi:hypothetical protein
MGKILAASVLLFSALTLAASAQIPPDYGIKATASAAGLPTGQPSISAVTAGIINTLLSVVGALAVVLIIYAGFLWMTSAGNEEKISTAKKILAGSVVGLLIIFSAYTIAVFVVKQIAKSSGSTPTQNAQVQNSCGEVSELSICADQEDCNTLVSHGGHIYGQKDCGTQVCCSPN